MPPPDQIPDPRIVALPASEIRRRFVEFFEERGHTAVPSAGLVPAGDADAAVHELRDGPVQGGVHRRGNPVLHPRRGLPALPARRRQAQRLRGGRPDAAPPHPLRDARQLELRRLLQARGDPLGLGVPDARHGHPRRPPRGHDLHGRRGRVRRSGATRSACRPSGWRAGATSTTATTRTSGGWPIPAPAARAARSTSTEASSSPKVPIASPTTTSTARAGSRSGTSSSWSSISEPDGPHRRCRSRASTPAWASSGSPASSSRCPPTTTRTCSPRSTPAMRELMGHDPDAFEAERFSYQVIADHSRAVTFLIADDVLPVQRGPRLRPSPDPAAGRPARPPAGPARAVHGRDGGGRHRGDGRRLPAPASSGARRSSPRSPARRPSSRGRSMPARASSRTALSGAHGCADRVVGRRPEELPADVPRCSPATSPSVCTTRTASRST